MSDEKRRVAVIGTGPAGAIATDALVKEQSFDTIRVFERQNIAGGTWVFTHGEPHSIPSLRDIVEDHAEPPLELPSVIPSKTPKADEIGLQTSRYSNTAAHEHLHSNLPPDIMGFTQEPISKTLSERTLARYGPDAPFRHREVIREWVEDIFKRDGNDRFVEFNTSVELVEKTGDEWVLTLRKTVLGESEESWWQETFDAVVVATGHYYVPFIPAIPGLVDYDQKFPGRIKHTKHYRTTEEFKDKRVLVVGGSVSGFDALHDIRVASKLPIISSLRTASPTFGWSPFTHPDIDNRPPISSFDPETGRITFADETFVSDVDVVMFATGYDFSFPFLPSVKPVNQRIPGLYQHVFKTSDPTLAFVGMVTGGFGIRIFEWQAVAAARVLAGHATLPPRKEMEDWEQDRISKCGNGPLFWTLSPNFEEHFEALRAIAGEPAAGTRGRVLPKYDPKWAEILWQFVDYRIRWWKEEAAKAEEERATDLLAAISNGASSSQRT
ncbi:hypothetical protein AK830_g9520 [Neonectria ditissima]|uniref:Thiol-specific monooxygenase n=1 Tax=Neonectria ditissima TaxID=78410 RepID=A0A0P7B8Y5_9HYPO|nr:hypothetical protein AK830_g9520 [Neonectria ditissima]